MKCVICKKGRAEGVTLYRINEVGVRGLWACRVHLSQTDGPKPDPIVEEIVSAIEHGEEWNQPSAYPPTVPHTRGPWRTQGWVPTWAYIPVHDAQHNLVCSMYPSMKHGYGHESVLANANLIVASPDMLAALKAIVEAEAAMLKFLLKAPSSQDEEGWSAEHKERAQQKAAATEAAFAAIAKAEGRS